MAPNYMAVDSQIWVFCACNCGGSSRDRTENLLIKSKLLFVHRRVQQSTAGTILRLKVNTVPTGHKLIVAFWAPFAAIKNETYHLTKPQRFEFVWGLW